MDARNRLHLDLTASGEQARQEVRRLREEIEKLRDKRVKISVDQDSVKELGQLPDLHRRAAGGARDHARATASASASARDHARATRELGRGLRELDRAGAGAGRLGSAHRDAAAQTRALAGSAREANSEVRQLGRQSRVVARMGGGFDNAAESADAYARSVNAAADARRAFVRAGRGGGGGGRDFDSEFDDIVGREFGGRSGGGGAVPPRRGGGGFGGGGFGDDFDGLSRRLPGLTSGMRGFGGAAGMAMNAVQGLGMASVYSVVGMSALVAGTAAVGLGSAVGVIAKSGPMMAEVRRGVRDFGDEFQDASGKAAAFVPHMVGLRQATTALGGTLAGVGVGHMAEGLASATGVVKNFDKAVKRLDESGAISSSIQAVGAVVNAGIGAIGNSAPQIAQFANTVTAAAPGLQSVAQSTIQMMTAMGGAGVQALDRFAPVIKGAAGGVSALADATVGFFGGTSNYAQPGSTEPSPMGTGGKVFAALGGGIIGTLGATVASTVDALTPGALFGGKVASADMVPTQAGGMIQNAPVAYNPDLSPTFQGGQTSARPGQQTFQPHGAPAPVAPPTAPTSVPQLSQFPQVARPGQTWGPVGPGQSVGQIPAQLQQLQQQYGATGQAAQQFGSTTTNAMTQAGAAGNAVAPHMASQMQGATAAVQGAQAAIPPAAQQAFGAIQPAAQAAQPAAAIQPAISQTVKSVSDMSGAMSDAGAGLGASMTSGAAAGITTTQEVTLTVVKKYTKRVVEEGKDGIDAHSPSKKFWEIGQWAGQGMAGGMDAAQGIVGSSANKMTQKGAGSGVEGIGGGKGIGKGAEEDLSKPTGERGQPVDYSKPGEGFSGTTTYQPKDVPASLERRGFSDETNQRVMDRLQKNSDYWNDKRATALENKQAASYRALVGPDAAIPGDIGMQAELWRGTGRKTPGVVGGGETPGGGGRPPLPELAKPYDPGGLRPLSGAIKKDATTLGGAIPEGLARGTKDGISPVKDAARTTSMAALEEMRRKLQISSPSRATYRLGGFTAQGFGNGLADGSDAIRGIADNAGLQVGMVYGRSFITGADSVIRKADLEGVTKADVPSEQASAWLGAAGLAAPAGAGAQVLKNAAVAIGAVVGQTQTTTNLNLNLDSKPLKQWVIENIGNGNRATWEQFLEAQLAA